MFEKIIKAFRLMLDRRVPISLKMIPALTLLYVISPLDLIPEAFLFGIGFADDIALAMWVVNFFVNRATREIEIIEAHDAPTRKNEPAIY
ncbi:MAG: DUF1232 domain-containing protein [Chloroflexi bacterium]|nr:DUF1232 domain-containing protein [Chloroflexota bacterium]